MKEWKARQKFFHLMNASKELGDDLAKEKIIEEWDDDSIVLRALQYPIVQTNELHYPGKSYAIAVTYAEMLVRNFGGEIKEYLNDPELLFGNDPYFTPYSAAPAIYDQILVRFPFHLLDRPKIACENFRRTIDYFNQEFLLTDETKQYVSADT